MSAKQDRLFCQIIDLLKEERPTNEEAMNVLLALVIKLVRGGAHLEEQDAVVEQFCAFLKEDVQGGRAA